ncbi:hypothetical protein [Roseibium sp.]|uniref:hypothetical protein n=1 Tax=Roseibium sp. TaxID=1936156 RepID=UPI003A98826A
MRSIKGMLQKTEMLSEQSVAISVDVVRGNKTESFRRKDSILRIWIMKRLGRVTLVMVCSQIARATLVFLATKIVGSHFEKIFSDGAKKAVCQSSVLAFGRLETLLRDMKWGAFQANVTDVFSPSAELSGKIIRRHPFELECRRRRGRRRVSARDVGQR